MRRVLLFLVACHSQPVETQTQPQPQALPQATASTTPAVSIPAPPTATIRPIPGPICEPTVTCGRWSRCRWLEFDHAERDYDVFRAVGSDAGGYGSHYWRVHQCWQEAVGPTSCARYCDAAGRCDDGLTADAICTVSSPPKPSPYVCEVHGKDCVTR